MVYTNPSVYACLEREYSATPIVSLRNRRKVGTKFYELDHFYGTIFVKTNSSITKISGAHEMYGKWGMFAMCVNLF